MPAPLHGTGLMIDYGMIKGRILLVFSIILAAGILIILGYNNRNVTVRPSYQTSSMKNLHLTHKEEKKVQWELLAENAIFPVGRKEIILETIDLKINHSPEIYLTSDSGIYDVDKGDVMLNKPVEINIKDTKFSTDTLNWNSSDELISTLDAVTFEGSNFLIKGIGLSAKIEQQKVKIEKNVKAIFYR